MTPASTYLALVQAGLTLTVPDGRHLHVSPRSRITDALRALIVEHRDPLVALIRTGAEPTLDVNPVLGRAEIVDRASDPANLIATYNERLAIVLEAGDIPEPEAHRIVSEEVCADLAALAGLQVAAWRAHIESFTEPLADPALARLRRDLLVILGERWVLDAAQLGWDVVAMLGLHPTAPLVRVDCWGAAVAVALDPHNRRSASGVHRARVVAIDQTFATIELPTGLRTKAGRFARGLDIAVPIWEVPGFAQPTKH